MKPPILCVQYNYLSKKKKILACIYSLFVFVFMLFKLSGYF
jgi:hypothetical protein